MNVPAGPWEAVAVSETEPYQVVGEYVVASDLPCEDAWLIAAAPDLYEALVGLMAAVGQPEDGGSDMDAWNEAKAALAKARGATARRVGWEPGKRK